MGCFPDTNFLWQPACTTAIVQVSLTSLHLKARFNKTIIVFITGDIIHYTSWSSISHWRNYSKINYIYDIYSKLRSYLPLHVFYDSRLWYIVNQSGSTKGAVSLKIGKNIEILILFEWGHKTAFWLISIIIIKWRWINIKTEHKYI